MTIANLLIILGRNLEHVKGVAFRNNPGVITSVHERIFGLQHLEAVAGSYGMRGAKENGAGLGARLMAR